MPIFQPTLKISPQIRFCLLPLAQEVTEIKHFEASAVFSEHVDSLPKEVIELGYSIKEFVDSDGIFHIRVYRSDKLDDFQNLWEPLKSTNETAALEPLDLPLWDDSSEDNGLLKKEDIL